MKLLTDYHFILGAIMQIILCLFPILSASKTLVSMGDIKTIPQAAENIRSFGLVPTKADLLSE